jgi:Flp pilus assembly protein TadG
VPVLLILLLIAIDFGRLFSSWVTLNNAARVAANYAASDPTPDDGFGPASEYASQVNAEGFGSLNPTCATGGVPQPVFSDTAVDTNSTTTNLGDEATVAISCTFRVMTPIISAIVGNNLPMSASSTFVIRGGDQVYLP